MKDEAYRRYQAGDLRTAETLCQQLLQQQPPPAEAVYLLGVISQDRGQWQNASRLGQQTVSLAPDNAVFVNTLGESSMLLGQSDQALICFREAIRLRPTYERAHNNLGRICHALGDLDTAEASFTEAVRLNPNYATALNNLGAIMQVRGRFDAAGECFRKAIALKPDYPEAHFNLGAVLQSMGDPIAAVTQFQRAIELRPTYARAYFLLGQALEHLRRDFAALAAYQQAARLQPDDGPTQQQLGNLLTVKGDWTDALTALKKAHSLQANKPETFARLFYCQQLVCDWQNYDANAERLWADSAKALADGEVPAATPFQALTLPWSLQQQLAIAQSHTESVVREQKKRGLERQPIQPAASDTGRLRIGYLSGDFYDHPISHLLHGLFGQHDRNKFELFAYGFGKQDQSQYRQRIVAECEHFVDVSLLSIPALAQRIAADGIHILVDLMGHTGVNRFGALALRPAPIQVNFLGNLGTLGGDFMDYLITDRTLTPPAFAPYFVEKFATMPHSYLIAELEPPQPEQTIDRVRYGLPEIGFVYCSFNSSYKLEPKMFDVWMRILKRVNDSVLWLYSTGKEIEDNLQYEAQSRGVSPERLIFAPLLPRPEHMLRHRAADLFLDSLYYNAAATASLSLQMGLPVLALLGDTFGSRIGASLLNTAGLPELIATDLTQYEDLAVRMAEHPDELTTLKHRLDHKQLVSSPLFDTKRFARNLEQAFENMWKIHAAGRPPEAFEIEE